MWEAILYGAVPPLGFAAFCLYEWRRYEGLARDLYRAAMRERAFSAKTENEELVAKASKVFKEV